MLIVRNLLVGGQRYEDLLETLPGITTNLLAARLRDLGEAGLIAQRTLPPPATAVVYELTAEGRGLEPVVLALGRFGARYLRTKKRGDRTHVRWAMVSLKRRYLGSSTRGTIAREVDGEHGYRLELGPNALEIEAGPPQSGDVRVELDSPSLRSLLFEGGSARALVERGAIALTGPAEVFFDLVRAVGASV